MEHNAWINQADEATIMREIRERVANRGWNDVRPALDLTVRAWIMHAFLLRSIPDYSTAVQLLQKVLRFLMWGDHQWPTIPTSERGIIFEPTFRRSVRRLYLHTLYQVSIIRVPFIMVLTPRAGCYKQPRPRFTLFAGRAQEHRVSYP
jgi:hypothetical protein